MAPRISNFSIVLGAKYSFYEKFIASYAPHFLGTRIQSVVYGAGFFYFAIFGKTWSEPGKSPHIPLQSSGPASCILYLENQSIFQRATLHTQHVYLVGYLTDGVAGFLSFEKV